MNESPLQHAVVILAAGASRRLGTAKQLLSVDGELLVNRVIRIALTTNPAQTVLVLGHRADEIHAAIDHENIERVDCADWQSGMSASLHAGIRRVNAGCDGALILLCDQVLVTGEHLQSLLQTWRLHRDHAVASAYGATRGVPAVLPRSWFSQLSSIDGDQGARELLRTRPDVITIETVEPARDIDFPEDIQGNVTRDFA